MEEKARADLALARREGLPDFTLGIEYMNRRDMDDAWTGMFGLTLPIWRWSKVGPQRREAEAHLMAAAAERRRVLNESISMAREAYAMAITSRDRVRVYEKEILPDAEMALASSLASYPTGEMRLGEVIDMEKMLLELEMRQRENIFEYLKARASLALAIGDDRILGVGDE